MKKFIWFPSLSACNKPTSFPYLEASRYELDPTFACIMRGSLVVSVCSFWNSEQWNALRLKAFMPDGFLAKEIRKKRQKNQMSHFSSWPGQPGRKARLVTGQAAGPAAGSFTTARLQLVNPFCKTTEMPIWMIYKESHFEKCLLTLELLLTRPSQLWLMATAHCIQINHFLLLLS